MQADSSLPSLLLQLHDLEYCQASLGHLRLRRGGKDVFVGGYRLPEHALFCDPGDRDACLGPFLAAGGNAEEAQSDSHCSPFPLLEHDPKLSLIPDMVRIIPKRAF